MKLGGNDIPMKCAWFCKASTGGCKNASAASKSPSRLPKTTFSFKLPECTCPLGKSTYTHGVCVFVCVCACMYAQTVPNAYSSLNRVDVCGLVICILCSFTPSIMLLQLQLARARCMPTSCCRCTDAIARCLLCSQQLTLGWRAVPNANAKTLPTKSPCHCHSHAAKAKNTHRRSGHGVAAL